MPRSTGGGGMDEELRRFWQHHDPTPVVGAGDPDINIRDGAKGWDGKPIKRRC